VLSGGWARVRLYESRCGDRQEQEGRRLPIGALHALRVVVIPSAATKSRLAGPDASPQQGLAGFPGGAPVQDVAHVDLPPGLRRDGDAIEIEDTTRSPGTVSPGLTRLSGSAGERGRDAWHPGQGPAARGGHLRSPHISE
jgi:hypothetical protein